MKTLGNIEEDTIIGTPRLVKFSGDLRQAAREWIKDLEQQKELHYKFLRDSTGMNPNFDLPDGFDYAGSSVLPWGYDAKIKWIKHFFNLEKKV